MLLVALSPLAVHAKPRPATKGKASGKWHLMVLDGNRLLDSERRDSPFKKVSFPAASAGKADGQNGWSLQLGMVRPPQVHHTSFNPAVGIPVAGDFNGDGFDELGVFAGGVWYLDYNGNNVWDEGDLSLSHGGPGDLPVVGDWNEDGKADIGVYSDAGRSNAVAVVGDWSGTGSARIGLFHDGVWHLDTDGDGDLTSTDTIVRLGEAGDRPVVGDFNRDGSDELGVYRAGRWFIDRDGDRRIDHDDLYYTYGDPRDLPVVGDWDGDGRDQVGLMHR